MENIAYSLCCYRSAVHCQLKTSSGETEMPSARFREKILREVGQSQAWLCLWVRWAFREPEQRQKLKLPRDIKISECQLSSSCQTFQILSFLSVLCIFKFCRFLCMACICAWLLVCMNVHGVAGTYACIWKPEVDIWSLPGLLSTMQWGSVSQLNPELVDWSREALQIAPVIPWLSFPRLTLPWRITTHYPALMWVLGIQTWVFMCAWQLFYPLSHLPSPQDLYFLNK